MAEIIRSSDRRGGLSGGFALALVVYAVVATLFDPHTWPMRIATAIPCIVLVILAIFRGWHRRRMLVAPSKPGVLGGRGLVVWTVLIAAVIIIQLLNYYEWPRTVYPTLSSLAGQVYHIHPVRAISFWLWLWLGWYLVDR